MSEKKLTREADTSTLYEFKGSVPKPSLLVPLSLQHVLAAVVGVITPSIIIAGVCGLTESEKTMMIQAALLLTAIATLLQLFPIFNRLGAGLPVIMGTSFAYVPTLQAIGGEFDMGTILGAEIIGGIVAIIFGIFVKEIRKLFPDVVTGTVIFTIGLSLYPTAIKYMAGGAGSKEFGSMKNWVVALCTFGIVLILSNFTKGIFKLGSLFFGMIAGYLLALAFGMVDFSSVTNTTAIVAVPQFMHFQIKFVPSACISLAIVYIVNSVQTIGDLTSTTMGGMDRVPTNRELQGGILTQGVMSAGFIPVFSAALTTIPQSVIGGATLSVFAQIAMTGVRMFTKDGLTARKTTVVGMSVALGVGITQVADCLSGPGLPGWINSIFGSSSVVVATIMAILLNLILPKEETAAETTEETKE